MKNVFVAPKIRVGFQKRDDTFTGQLAYIIYYDDKGKIRKEQSWNSWRDKKITPQEFDNKPMDGFTLNKDIKRYSGEWFSSHRTMIRVHDPRGFEFEVTTENLIAILMHTDCLKRGLIGEFVYAWIGPELVLLPTNSEEYQAAVKFTSGLGKKVKAKEMVPGVSYTTKREGNVIYIGKFNWYEYAGKYSQKGLRKEENAHIFTKDDGKTFFKKKSVEFLSEANSPNPVSNYAELVEKFNKKVYANKIVKFEFRPSTFNPSLKKDKYDYYGPKLCRTNYFSETHIPGVFKNEQIAVNTSRIDPNSKGNEIDLFKVDGYDYSTYHYGHEYEGIRQDTGEIVMVTPKDNINDRYGYGYSYGSRETSKTLEQMQAEKLYDLYVIFENGKSRKVYSLYHISTGTDELVD